MFTGIVQGKAKIISVDKKQNFYTQVVKLPDYMLSGLKTGDSIAQNGCCLTVTKINEDHISFDLVKETLRTTNLVDLVPGDIVNVERAAKLGDEIGGHYMSGHIVTTAEVKKISILEKNYQIWFKLKNPLIMKYIFHKGFIGIDGISLTIGKSSKADFCVYLIPETLKRTTLGIKKVGQHVNIEIDMNIQAIVNTVERIISSNDVRADFY